VGTEPPVLALLRERLERELPGASAAVLFEALNAWGPRVPVAFVDVVAFVHGPLRQRLFARLGAERGRAVLREIERALRLAEQPTRPIPRLDARAFDEETTTTLARVEGAFDVAVVSRSGALAERIAAALDPARIALAVVSSALSLARVPRRLHVVLVDASDLPALDPGDLGAALAHAPLALVWACDAPPAALVIAALERACVRVMTFAQAEPPDPMIDVLRARLR